MAHTPRVTCSLTLKLTSEACSNCLSLPPQHLFHFVTTYVGPELEWIIFWNMSLFTHFLLDVAAVHYFLLSVYELYIFE
jgi:hypothetical protein